MSAPRRAPGRPPSSEVDAALVGAAADLLAEVGYDSLSLAEVARRAGTSMPALYRRYRDKNALVLAAIEHDLEVNVVRVESHGTLRDDLVGLLEASSEKMTADRLRVLAALLLARDTEPELAGRLMAGVLSGHRPALTEVLQRAASRGGRPTSQDRLDAVATIIPALVVTHGLVNGAGPGRDDVVRAVDEILLPLLAAPDAEGRS